ncbi:hypothetical protein BDC45DRAFT_523239 [Circinella umbellata]|nr:hypothetical protein BDC45DRAFT_523239 [Circinella umbellata]
MSCILTNKNSANSSSWINHSHRLDLMTSPLNPILGHHHERTSAIYGVIPIINALFLQYNDKALIEWIGIESDATKRHKWDGVMITNKKPNATIMTIEFAGRFGNEKERENVSDFQKVYRNALRVFNPDSPSASAPYPRIFTVLTSHNKVFFESLVQIDNEVYVRRRSAELTLPTSFSSFQDAVEALPSIFTWRDAVVNYTVSLPKDNQTKNAFETVSPLSSQ